MILKIHFLNTINNFKLKLLFLLKIKAKKRFFSKRICGKQLEVEIENELGKG